MRNRPERAAPPWWLLAVFTLALGLAACSNDSPVGDNPGQDQDNIDDQNNGQSNNGNNGQDDVCGDGICGPQEDDQSCAADCSAANNDNNDNNSVACGNGTCDAGETPSNCPSDCVEAGCDCAPEETCVTNAEVNQVCYPNDCDGQACGEDQVCQDGACISVSCAGVDCGGYPNVCRGGACVVGSCSDVDVRCPDGQACIDDECRASCATQADCGSLACVDGYCVVCENSGDCGPDLLCVADQCVPPCTENPGLCTGGEVCNPDNGQCEPPCTQTGCGVAQICDDATGMCIDGECEEMADCPGGHVCRDNGCVAVGPLFMGGLSSGAASSGGANHRSLGVVSPVEAVGPPAQSQRYLLQTGTLSITAGE